MTSYDLFFELDKPVVGSNKALRQNLCNVKQRDRIFSEQRWLGNMEL